MWRAVELAKNSSLAVVHRTGASTTGSRFDSYLDRRLRADEQTAHALAIAALWLAISAAAGAQFITAFPFPHHVAKLPLDCSAHRLRHGRVRW